jgi:UDP-GlcNAc:undecaprenyl-phosphate GlcNAc-1-phosphate transferase
MIILFFTFLVTIALTYIFIFVNKKIGLIDDPKRQNHPGIIHVKPIPRGGGIPIFFGCFLASLVFIPQNPLTASIFFAAFVALTVGVIDDYLNAKGKDVSAYIRFISNILVAIIVVAGGVSIQFITNPLGGILNFDAVVFTLPFLAQSFLLSDIITVVWLIWIMNMLNWSKGIDGQMPGIVAISAVVIAILSIKLHGAGNGNAIDANLSFIIAGSALGFLVFNYYPAKIFPGYGATSLYLLLGVASILTGAKLATAILVMGVPLVDFVFTIIRRIISKKSPFKGDKNHLHHKLLELGYSQRQIALFYWIISAILGVISLTLESASKVFAIIMLIAIVGGGLFFLHAVTKNANDKVTS